MQKISRFQEALRKSKLDAAVILTDPNVTYFTGSPEFIPKFEEFNPEVVITHLIHPHSFAVLDICKKKNIP